MRELSGPPAPAGFTLVHAAERFLVLDKPAGLLCVPGRGADKQDCLAARVRREWPEALVVHRLDMATSGLVLMARGADSQRGLSIAFASRTVTKRYEAVVDGIIDQDGGTVDLPLIADWPARPRQKVCHATGKPSVSHWRVLSRDALAGTTRLQLEPVTGRSHQLRVHMHAIGHPILGDTLYAPPPVQAASARLMLHACDLAFADPATGLPLAFHSAPPF